MSWITLNPPNRLIFSPRAYHASPFEALDDSGLSPVSHYSARNGTTLAYRHYGTRGDIAYIGQLEDDLEDFVHAVKPVVPATLVGFSSGGGFALRVAGSMRQRLFSGYLLLSPFISQGAPTHRSSSGGWVSVGLPRYIAITLLNRIGIQTFNHLPVVRYALNEEAEAFLTPAYSFTLAQNYRPKSDYLATIRAVEKPLRVVAGQDDEVFHTDRFKDTFRAAGKDVSVTLVPGVGHIELTLDSRAIRAVIGAVGSLNGSADSSSGTTRTDLTTRSSRP